jgi:hypothetical protein
MDMSGLANTSWTNYGDSFFLLKPHVRSRVTWTGKDSADVSRDLDMAKHPELDTQQSVGTPDACAHLLLQFSDKELRAAIRVATGRAFHIKNDITLSSYKEIQVPPHHLNLPTCCRLTCC